jgi:hypothetical protein
LINLDFSIVNWLRHYLRPLVLEIFQHFVVLGRTRPFIVLYRCLACRTDVLAVRVEGLGFVELRDTVDALVELTYVDFVHDEC